MTAPELWFRARSPDRGTGYGVVHWKGVAVTLAWVAAMALIVGAVTTFLAGRPLLALAVAIVSVVAASFVYLRVVKAHSDWNG